MIEISPLEKRWIYDCQVCLEGTSGPVFHPCECQKHEVVVREWVSLESMQARDKALADVLACSHSGFGPCKTLFPNSEGAWCLHCTVAKILRGLEK